MEHPKAFNVLVTGTPGTGKTTMGEMLAQELGLNHIEIGKVVKDHGFHSGHNDAFDTLDVTEDDEDRLLDHLEPIMVRGNNVVDYHSCDFFPKRWFHLVIVLRADTSSIFDRLTSRGYNAHKRDENVEAEIVGVTEEAARDSYDEDVVFVRTNDSIDEMMETVAFIADAMANFRPGEADAAE
jgi:adenylate kinase